jgi:hypothetical protein
LVIESWTLISRALVAVQLRPPVEILETPVQTLLGQLVFDTCRQEGFIRNIRCVFCSSIILQGISQLIHGFPLHDHLIMEELPLIFLEKPQRIDTGGGSQLAAIFISIFCMFFLGCRRDLDAAISILDCDAGGKEVVENLSCVDIVLLLRLKLLNPGLQFRLLLLGTVDRGLPHGCFLPVSFCLSFCPSAFQTYLEHICSDTFMGCKTMKIWVRQ